MSNNSGNDKFGEMVNYSIRCEANAVDQSVDYPFKADMTINWYNSGRDQMYAMEYLLLRMLSDAQKLQYEIQADNGDVPEAAFAED